MGRTDQRAIRNPGPIIDSLLDLLTLYGRATRRRIQNIYPYQEGKWLLVSKREFLVVD